MTTNDKIIRELEPVDKSIFTELESMLSNVLLTQKDEGREGFKRSSGSFRRNFAKHRAEVFGIVKLRPAMGGNLTLSKCSTKRPQIYDELMKIGNIICPFEFSSILVNNNTVCGKHYDANNVGKSLLVSIGDFEGCNIVIEDVVYSAKYKPIIFNGAKCKHWNTDDLVGNKWSLVFYNLYPDKGTC